MQNSPSDSYIIRVDEDKPSYGLRLSVIGEGGAIISYERDGICTPDKQLVMQLCRQVPGDIRRLFSKAILKIPPSGLRMSKDVSLERLMECVHIVRQKLAKGYSTLLLTGSHALPKYAMAIMLGVSPAELYSQNQHNTKDAQPSKSILLAASRHGMGTDSEGVEQTMRDGFALSADPLMKGRAGVLYRDHVYALSELRCPNDAEYLSSGFLPIAYKNSSNSWQPTALRKHHMPMGDGGPFTLDPHVKTFFLDANVDRADDVAARVLESNPGADLKGVVLASNNFRHPIVTSDEDLLQTLDGVNIPIVLVGQKSLEEGELFDQYNYLIDGRHMPPEQTEVMLAYWLQQSRDRGIRVFQERVGYLKNKFKEFPHLSQEFAQVD